MKFTKPLLPSILGGLLIFSGCNSGPEYYDELDLAITVKDENIDYSQYQTYVMPDSVVYLGPEGSDLTNASRAFILNEIEDRFTEAGWTRQDSLDSNTTDVIIMVSVLKNVSMNISAGWYSDWSWWYGWGYYGGYPGGYYPGYPGYFCCYTAVYSFTEGTLLIEMLDPNNAVVVDEKVSMPLLWSGMVNGLAEGSKSGLNTRISNTLDRVFDDSPYLYK